MRKLSWFMLILMLIATNALLYFTVSYDIQIHELQNLDLGVGRKYLYGIGFLAINLLVGVFIVSKDKSSFINYSLDRGFQLIFVRGENKILMKQETQTNFLVRIFDKRGYVEEEKRYNQKDFQYIKMLESYIHKEK